ERTTTVTSTVLAALLALTGTIAALPFAAIAADPIVHDKDEMHGGLPQRLQVLEQQVLALQQQAAAFQRRWLTPTQQSRVWKWRLAGLISSSKAAICTSSRGAVPPEQKSPAGPTGSSPTTTPSPGPTSGPARTTSSSGKTTPTRPSEACWLARPTVSRGPPGASPVEAKTPPAAYRRASAAGP